MALKPLANTHKKKPANKTEVFKRNTKKKFLMENSFYYIEEFINFRE